MTTEKQAELLGIWFAPLEELHAFDGGRRLAQYAILTVKWPAFGQGAGAEPTIRHTTVTRERALRAQKRGDLL